MLSTIVFTFALKAYDIHIEYPAFSGLKNPAVEDFINTYVENEVNRYVEEFESFVTTVKFHLLVHLFNSISRLM